MIVQYFLEISAIIFFSYAVLIVVERNKSNLHMISLMFSILLFLEILTQIFRINHFFSPPVGGKILFGIQIIFIGVLLAEYKSVFERGKPGSFFSAFGVIAGWVGILEVLLWLGAFQYSDLGKPDFAVYIIVPLGSLIILSYLALSSIELTRGVRIPGSTSSINILLSPLVIGYLFFNHIWYPYTFIFFPSAAFYVLMTLIFGGWLYKSKIISLEKENIWFFVPLWSVYLTFILIYLFNPKGSISAYNIKSFNHIAVVIIVLMLSYILYWSYRVSVQREKSGTSSRDVTRFVQDLYKHLNWDRLGSYVCNYLTIRFGANRVALITKSVGSEPFKILGAINFLENELMRLLNSKDIKWFDFLGGKETVLMIDGLPRNSVIELAFQSYKIGAIIPLKDAGKVNGMIIISDDVSTPAFTSSDIKELELIAVQINLALEQITLTEKYYENEKMAEIGSFASQLAHDFRSFLSIIQLAPESTPLLKNLARQTGNMIQDLLTFVRPDELKLMPTDFNAMIESSIQMINIPEQVKIEKNYEKSLPEIASDINQMHRVFSNLLNNAVRAVMAKEGGRIKITTRVLRTFNVFEKIEWVYVEILDEGEGIPERNLDKIFKPFFTSYKDRGGSGLGLSIVKKIIEAHGGTIDVTSVIGKGTAFNIRMPLSGKFSVNYS